MPFFIDQINHELELNTRPERIVCLVPSITEFLFDIGLADSIVGVTKFCIHPVGAKQDKVQVGGTKNVKLDVVAELNPDLIIASKEENTQGQIESLMQEYPTWVSDIKNLDDAFVMMKQIGFMTDKEQEVVSMINEIQTSFDAIPQYAWKPRVAYLIWRKPYMTIGGDTFINSLLELAGYENAFSDCQRYPQVTIEELKQLNLDFIFLSSEPYPFSEKHISELQEVVKPVLVDGECFSWYGSHLLQSESYFTALRNEKIQGALSGK